MRQPSVGAAADGRHRVSRPRGWRRADGAWVPLFTANLEEAKLFADAELCAVAGPSGRPE